MTKLQQGDLGTSPPPHPPRPAVSVPGASTMTVALWQHWSILLSITSISSYMM